ncbi:hypothetical protein [Tunturiibacter gelidoferens]|uniref:Uncharacterized protein n=2 Tax=Tunturiibacter TaxID=3154218 RepID=A0A7Y9NL69_9BACT|nr:hypothetical protein [Edaphobacter lichenicola]MBB5339524.1 hypothetical protein [Edaphobacter lichenicola]NYF51197.1 hypothetical protein [Edaphobacter lichenicola]
MIQTLGNTTNFTINYQDTNYTTNPPTPFVNVLQRAQQLKATCEADFTQLRSWFAIHDGFGPTNLVTLQIEPDSYAHNFGYKSDGTTFVRMNPFDSSTNQDQANDAVQALFVAEIIEVLMNYRNIKAGPGNITWHPSQSDGEALSRFAAALLHPVGYYNILGAPFVNTWLQSTRPDWVTKLGASDTDLPSLGCSLLFLYYLYDQLDLTIPNIIQKGGATPELTYQNLTGQNGGFTPFKQLLDTYLPYNTAQHYTSLLSDNPFPILQGNNRSIFLSFSEDLIKSVAEPLVDPRVTVSPFLTCPAKDYRYSVLDLTCKLHCVASVTGFAQPKFSWHVNSLQADNGGSINITTPVTVDLAAHPEAPQSTTGQDNLYWSIPTNSSTYTGPAGELDLTNTGSPHPGHEHLTIQVDVTEAFGSTDSVSQIGSGTLDTKKIVYEPSFYTDRQQCLHNFVHELGKYKLVNRIPLIFNLPDPPPELGDGIRILVEIIQELQLLRGENSKLAATTTKYLSQKLQIPQSILSVPLAASPPEAGGPVIG